MQDHKISLLPLPPLPWIFAHMLLCLSSPPENVHPCAESELLHPQMMISALFEELFPRSSTHLPPYPLTVDTCVEGGGADEDEDELLEVNGVQSRAMRKVPVVLRVAVVVMSQESGVA